MCWVSKIPGQSAGSLSSTSFIASAPPVEAPIIMSFSVLIFRHFTAGKITSADKHSDAVSNADLPEPAAFSGTILFKIIAPGPGKVDLLAR